MAENSKIEWTTHTFNPWRGCTKISAGCANCYAEKLSARNPRTLGVWGSNGTRVVASEAMWREPVKWDQAAKEAGERHRVFCASLADVFEEWNGPMVNANSETLYHPNNSWEDRRTWIAESETTEGTSITMDTVRQRLFELIRKTPNLDWLILSKRPEHMAEFVRLSTDHLAGAIAGGHWPSDFPNVWLGTTVENREAKDRIDTLRQIPAAVRFLSCEPLLEDLGELDLTGIHWVIVGGESGHDSRPMHPIWALNTRDQCQAAGVSFFFKQWGEWKPYRSMPEAEAEALYLSLPAGLPEDSTRTCKVTTVSFPPHPMPRGGPVDLMFKVGKKAAGRQLDGREWSEFPATSEASC